jgi:phosphatidylglycerophosphate synthase
MVAAPVLIDRDTHSDGGMVPTVRTGPVIGFAGQLAVLAVLAGTTGLGAGGALAGLAFGVLTWAVLHPVRLGPADRVTLLRATLVGGVTALVVDSFTRPVSLTVLVPLAAVALALDAVDGWVARRTDTISAFGARFDMEVDAYLILVLSAFLVRPIGGWVLAIGLARYVFVAAGPVLPWLRGELPMRRSAKVVAAVQGVVLVVAASGMLPHPASVAVVAAALALLAESFRRSIWWLWQHRAGEGWQRASVPGSAVRRRRHADPALRQRRDAAA